MSAPLADRLRPNTLDEVVGQRHLLAPVRLCVASLNREKSPTWFFTARPGWEKPLWLLSSPNRPTAACAS